MNNSSTSKNSQSSSRAEKICIEDKLKEKHTKTHVNRTNKDYYVCMYGVCVMWCVCVFTCVHGAGQR